MDESSRQALDEKVAEFVETIDEWAAFREVYTSIVGHATAGTPPGDPLYHEMSEFLWFITSTDDTEIQSLLQDAAEEYLPIAGWQDETPLQQATTWRHPQRCRGL